MNQARCKFQDKFLIPTYLVTFNEIKLQKIKNNCKFAIYFYMI